MAVPTDGTADATSVKPNLIVHDLGFSVLSQGIAPIADIVFIHGIQGHPQETWQFPVATPAKPKGSLRGLFRSKPKPEGGDDTNDFASEIIFWPKDLLSTDCQNARILTYGYDSRISHFFNGPANQNNISAHGRSLLNALELNRRECPKRPILFVVHSLGGIILKEALRRSRNAGKDDQDLRNIYQSTHAIIFFGTPHRGSAYAKVGIVAEHITKLVGFDTNAELLRNLKPDGGHLELLREEFSTMLDERSFKVYSFQEGKGFKGVNVLSRKIVDDASSSLDHPMERKDSINADHVMMCRFTSREDDGYIKVRGVITKYIEEIQKKNEQEQQILDMQQEKLRKIILFSLKTPAMNAREGQIDSAHTHTFEWVFTNPAAGFQDWMEGDHGIFWIKGKPGSGKSTLMKYILNDKRTHQALSSRDRTVLSMPSFFFHDRGVYETQKSFDGLLRSIIYQLLNDIPALTSTIAGIYFQQIEEQDQCAWSSSELEKALHAILQQQNVKGCICLFVDALDEYKGRKDGITRFLKLLVTPAPGQKLTVRICASSRDWNVFGLLLSENSHLTLQDWTVDDIERFASERLGEAKREGSEKLLEEITRRAEGVFLWVKLVIDELSEPLFNGEPISKLISSLSELPNELPDFYKRMLSNIPSRDRETAISMIELVLASGYYRINLSEFCLTVDLLCPDYSLPKDLSLARTEDAKRCEEMHRRVKACSGGLLVVQGRDVQFVHQTAKSFVEHAEDRASFGGKSAVDLAVSGLERVMRLLIQLFGRMDVTPGSLLFQHYFVECQEKCPEDYPHFDPKLIYAFIYLVKASQSLSRVTSQAVLDEFCEAIVAHCGPRWLETLWSAYDLAISTLDVRYIANGVLAPTSFLEFAVQNEMILVAEREIKENLDKYSGGIDGTKLLYYTVVGNGRMMLHTKPKQWQDLAKLFLEHDFDPNGILTLTVTYDKGRLMNGSIREGEREEREREEGEREEGEREEREERGEGREEETEDITPLHLALSIACSYYGLDVLQRIARLDMLRIVVEGGGDATLSYRNYWGIRNGEAQERTAVHYLLYKTPSDESPFDDPDLGSALSKCIISFLDNGLDPNKLDSDGLSILKCALELCPSSFIETLLQKGAKVTPNLLKETGEPLPGAGGILNEPKWRKPEFYTSEARDLGRRYNPDWADLEKQQEQVAQGGIIRKTKEIFQATAASLGTSSLGILFGKG